MKRERREWLEDAEAYSHSYTASCTPATTKPVIRKKGKNWEVFWWFRRAGVSRKRYVQKVKSFKTACMVARKWWGEDRLALEENFDRYSK
jgi:hypothetical protein